jgi:outer membrane protein OmpA-like peptidoglycan-associated protein
VGQSFVLNNIYYDYDKWDIRLDAARELDRVVQLINDNPHLSFELSAHTDARGSIPYNLVLSDARANSAVNYLIRRGADPARIQAMGYGEERLVNACRDGVKCNEEEHQANRRTEFKVVKADQASIGR